MLGRERQIYPTSEGITLKYGDKIKTFTTPNEANQFYKTLEWVIRLKGIPWAAGLGVSGFGLADRISQHDLTSLLCLAAVAYTGRKAWNYAAQQDLVTGEINLITKLFDKRSHKR